MFPVIHDISIKGRFSETLNYLMSLIILPIGVSLTLAVLQLYFSDLILVVTHHQKMSEKCPEAARCGEICSQGYTLKTEAGSQCPVCECVVVVTGTVNTKQMKRRKNMCTTY